MFKNEQKNVRLRWPPFWISALHQWSLPWVWYLSPPLILSEDLSSLLQSLCVFKSFVISWQIQGSLEKAPFQRWCCKDSGGKERSITQWEWRPRSVQQRWISLCFFFWKGNKILENEMLVQHHFGKKEHLKYLSSRKLSEIMCSRLRTWVQCLGRASPPRYP